MLFLSEKTKWAMSGRSVADQWLISGRCSPASASLPSPTDRFGAPIIVPPIAHLSAPFPRSAPDQRPLRQCPASQHIRTPDSASISILLLSQLDFPQFDQSLEQVVPKPRALRRPKDTQHTRPSEQSPLILTWWQVV